MTTTTDRNGPARSPIPLYIDCDTGIDDALALTYLLAEPAVRIVGIGTVFGNIDAVKAATNTLGLLELAGRAEIPVAVGAHDPLTGRFGGGAPSVHGTDGVGDVGLHPLGSVSRDETAMQLLARLAEEHGGSLRVLAIGPLTNLALFLEQFPDHVALISEVVVMGGAFEHRGNVTPSAEANIHNDPEAAQKVFQGAWPVTVLPLDITMRHVLTEQETIALGAIPGALPPAVSAMFDVYLDAYEGVYGKRQCALHDPLAALVAAGAVAVLSETSEVSIGVLTDGDERGRTVVMGQNLSGSSGSRIVVDVDGAAASLLLDRIRLHHWPSAASGVR